MEDDNQSHFPDELPFDFIKSGRDETLKEKSWADLSRSIGDSGAGKKGPRKGVFLLLSCAVVVLVGLYFFSGIYQRGKVEIAAIKTGDFQRQIRLPDSSEIILNRFSEIRADMNNWSDNKREVWLKGEAFFEIRMPRTAGKKYANFIVHTAKGDIEVLGTSFNVITDSSGFAASLNTGKIKAHIGRDEVVTLSPGQVLVVRNDNIYKKEVDVQLYSAWKDGRFHFDHTNLGEVVDLIKRYYKVKVRVGNDVSLEEKKLSGSIAVKDSTELFTALHVIMGLRVQQTGDSLIINK
jgi:ferric-dicitrate binding protein FerR (iron transport regulator)